jgi:hypothetical protein
MADRLALHARRQAHDRNGFISFIALVSMLGIALGVAALIVVLSVMNGFQKEVRDRMLSVLAHVEVFSPTGSMPDWQLTAQEARRNPSVIGAAPYVDAQALLTRQDAVRGVMLRVVEPSLEPQVSDIGKDMKAGRLDALVPGQFGIVLGDALAGNLGVTVGDKVTLVAPGHDHAGRDDAAAQAVHGRRRVRIGPLRIRQHARDDRHPRRRGAVPDERADRRAAAARDMQQAPQVAASCRTLSGASTSATGRSRTRPGSRPCRSRSG